MKTVILIQLSVSELKQIISEELDKFFSENGYLFEQEAEQKIIDLHGLLKAKLFI